MVDDPKPQGTANVPHDKAPAPKDGEVHKVDERVQEEAAKERSENEGYD